MARSTAHFQVPYSDAIQDKSGLLSKPWQFCFRALKQIIDPLGIENTASITNNQASAADIEGLSFNSSQVSQAIVDYVIQRITTSTGAVELLESGTFHLVYKPTSNTWSKVVIGTPGPSSSGVTLTVTSSGQVQYTSTNVTGTASISRIIFRARTFSGKHSQYSEVGR